jgi:DNA-binding GntR family transcriptional regulator
MNPMANQVARDDDVDPSAIERWQAAVRTQGNGSAADAVFRALNDAIVAGDLRPGSRLSEEKLASHFGVSRTPIREALTRLAETNIAKRDGRGTLRVEPVTAEKILEVYAVRGVLDGLAARLAAQTAGPLLFAELQEINDAMARAAAADDFTEMARHNIEFHSAIVRSTRNELLVQYVDNIHNWIRRIPSTVTEYKGRAEQTIIEHQGIVDAIAGRQPELAERLAREHMLARRD